MKPDNLHPTEFADASGGWAQFMIWARPRRGFVFRGQADPTWPVWSAYHRHMDALGDASEEETMLEPNSQYLVALNVAVHELYPELGEEFNLQKEKQRNEFLSIAQHHGFPTPLIDFTYSPYIAAYFAVRDATEGNSCRIFCVDDVALQAAIGGKRATQVAFVRPLAKHNPRIAVQRGIFILSLKSDLLRHLLRVGDYGTRNIYVRRSGVLKEPLVDGFLLNVTNKQDILSDLDLMGINEYTLFGGLDGALKYQKWKQLSPSTKAPPAA